MDKIRILLAEDHVVVRQGTRQLLEREDDLEVVGEAGDGEEAIELANKLKPDVVVMDIAMPKVNGIEATKAIKAASPTTAVLILTAYDYDEFIFSLLDAGAAGYLLKSVSGDELVHGIRGLHSGESVLHPAVLRKMLAFSRPRPVSSEERPAETLTQREMEVLRIAARGKANKDIAKELVMSIRTVQAHLSNIFNKLGVGSRTEAVVYCLKKGWLRPEDLP
ncbi:MAG: response regulator transcription factor [Pseudomonadota bacterium]